jgi:hypothetical protein
VWEGEFDAHVYWLLRETCEVNLENMEPREVQLAWKHVVEPKVEWDSSLERRPSEGEYDCNEV